MMLGRLPQALGGLEERQTRSDGFMFSFAFNVDHCEAAHHAWRDSDHGAVWMDIICHRKEDWSELEGEPPFAFSQDRCQQRYR